MDNIEINTLISIFLKRISRIDERLAMDAGIGYQDEMALRGKRQGYIANIQLLRDLRDGKTTIEDEI